MIGAYRPTVNINMLRKPTPLFKLNVSIMAGLAKGFPISDREEQREVALVRLAVVDDGGCDGSLLSLAAFTERVLSKEYHAAIAPGSRPIELSPALRFLASAIASHGPPTTKPALWAGVGVRDSGLSQNLTQTLSNVKSRHPPA
jgi:hypothetical protein